MSDSRTPTPAPREPSTAVEIVRALRWPLVLLFLVLIAVWLWLDTLDRGERGARAVADAVAGGAEALARGLLTGNVTEEFLSSIPEVERAAGRLEVASAKMTETFRRTEERRALWDLMPLGTTQVELQVPVTYRYHLPLDGTWHLVIEDGVCHVLAPSLTPTLPPAIHTDGLRERTAESLLRTDAEEQLASLRASLTPRLSVRAGNPTHLALVREESRRTVADFVRTWLLREDAWADASTDGEAPPGGVHRIEVRFADEPPLETEAPRRPTIERKPGARAVERSPAG